LTKGGIVKGLRWSGRANKGITVIELLVTFAVIALLIALLLPAVQSARRSANAVRCKNNLYQIGRAIHNFESDHRVFPGPTYARQLLPYLDQAALFARISADQIVHAVAVLEAVHTSRKLSGAGVPVYACPEDPLQQGINGLALNYLLNSGSGYGDFEDGFMKLSGELKAADITDGLSNTVAVAEKLLYSSKLGTPWSGSIIEPNPDQKLRNLANTDRFEHPSQRDAFLLACSTNAVWLENYGPRPCTPQGDCLPFLLNLLMPPNSHSCMNGFAANDWDPGKYAALTATSLHDGGVHILFADGSVRFVSSRIDTRLWQALGTRNGGEPAL